MTNMKDSRAKPFQRSAITKIKEYTFTAALNTAIPSLETEGFGVEDYLAVLVSVHPVNPDINNITAGADVTLRVWRWKRIATDGTGNQGSGQWYCDDDWTVPLDGDGSQGHMEQVFPVQCSERLYFQVVSVTDPEQETPSFKVTAYQIGPKWADPEAGFFESVAAGAATAGGGIQDVNVVEVLGNAATAGAGAVAAGTLRITWCTDSPGIGAHDAATANSGFRGLAVATSYDLADVAHNDDAHLVSTLDGKLIIAGYNRIGDYLRVQEVSPINYHMAWDLIEETGMGTGTFDYYLSVDSYGRMGVGVTRTLGSGTTLDLVIEGTIEHDDPDLTARTYYPETTAWTGGTPIAASGNLKDTNGFWGNFTAVHFEWTVVNASNDSAIRMDIKRFCGG